MAERSSSLIFAPSETATASRIAALICNDAGLPSNCCPVCTSTEMLRGALIDAPHDRCLAVLLAARPDELDQMVTLAEWLHGLPIILKIPDGDIETIAKAHLLRPRYLMGPTVDYGELRAVIHQIFLHGRKSPYLRSPNPQTLLVTLRGKAERFFRIKKAGKENDHVQKFET
jgi:hypothetical protein